MIARFAAFVLILYALGFALYSVTPGQPAPQGNAATDAIVVLTGGKGRIERGADLLQQKRGRRMLISGTDPLVTKEDLARRIGGKRKLFDCCVDLDATSVDTRANAEETRRWLLKHDFTSMRLVTSDYHMRRALYEFEKRLGEKVRIVPDAVQTEPRLDTLFLEYNKYVLRRLSAWMDI